MEYKFISNDKEYEASCYFHARNIELKHTELLSKWN